MNALPSLAGSLLLHPGRPVPNIVRTRPSALPALLRGRTAASLPGMLGALYTLCGAAHSLTARRAVAAAQGDDDPLSATEALALRAHAAREHVRCLLIDWPARLGTEPMAAPLCDADLLRRCPLLQPGKPAAAALQAMPAWLEVALLGCSAASLHRAWCSRGEVALIGWCEQGRTPWARLLRQAHAMAPYLRLPLHALRLHDDEAAQHVLAAQLAREPGFADGPALAAGCAETGAWTRAADPATPGAAPTAWHRLASRLVDLVILCGDDGALRLASGARATGPQQALAWTETARGLLVHWLALDGRGADARVHDCRVLAPTDWNFHPAGALAQALARLSVDATGQAGARLLLAAFDPCVEARCLWPAEAAHA